MVSAGLLMVRMTDGGPQVLLVHPGGPFFARKDEGSWSLPKGLVGQGEDPLAAARREMLEETGFSAEADHYEPLGEIRQKGGKVVVAWAYAGDCDPSQLRSNTFELEWPPRSGRRQPFPEADRAEFFEREVALRKILPAQGPFVERALSPATLTRLFTH